MGLAAPATEAASKEIAKGGACGPPFAFDTPSPDALLCNSA